jgi:two-component system KDP operon response regulator KdpE
VQAPAILIVDDEPQIRRFLRIALTANGYRVLEAGRGREGLELVATRAPDLVVLDLGLPDMDGEQVLQELRQWSRVPVIILSVRSDEGQKVRLLDAGADDYVTKPFGVQELVARVRVALRNRADREQTPARYEGGGLVVDFARRAVTLKGEPVHLSRKEYAILTLLASFPDRVVTQRQILEAVWGPHHTEDTHYLRVFVGRLRQKLGDDATNPRFIATEPGIGYRFLDAQEG